MEPELAAVATAYVLITVIAGPFLTRIPDTARFKALVRAHTLRVAAKPAEPIGRLSIRPLRR